MKRRIPRKNVRRGFQEDFGAGVDTWTDKVDGDQHVRLFSSPYRYRSHILRVTLVFVDQSGA